MVAAQGYDAVLGHTFSKTDFNAGWRRPPLVNGGIGVSFRTFCAWSSSLEDDQLDSLYVDPWAEWGRSPDLDLQDMLVSALRGTAAGSDIRSVAVFVHGFGDSGRGWPHSVGKMNFGSWPAIAAATFAASRPLSNLGVVLDWGRGVQKWLQYSRLMSSTRVVGLYLARLLQAARAAFGSGVQTWCVGHSLGAHACGLAGKYTRSRRSPVWDVISALDPAGPSVKSCRSIVTSWVEPELADARLAPDDAHRTEALFTDWGGLGFHASLAACIDKRHRYAWWHFQRCAQPPVRLAHDEIYVRPDEYTASGSIVPSWLPEQAFTQPGCSVLQTMFGCSHNYAAQLFLFALALRRAGGPGFSVASTCGPVDMSTEPLNMCPPGGIVHSVGILHGPPESTLVDFMWPRASSGLQRQGSERRSYRFEFGLPEVAELVQMYPDTWQGSRHSQCPVSDDMPTANAFV